MDANGVQIMDAKPVAPEFELPTFGQEKAVTGAQVGSAEMCIRDSWRSV